MTRPARAAALLAALAVLIGGCGLRTPSGVRVDQRSVDTSVDEPDIRKLPPGPAPGATPAQIVSGFLEASAADPDHSFALEFLASGSGWDDRDAATIYEPQSATPLKVTTRGAVSVVKFSAEGLGAIGSGGAFVPAERLLNLTFELRRVGGQWRLSRVPPGVLLTARDLSRSYRPVRTYNFSADGSELVAEPGYVVSNRAGLAGAALHALLSGWGDPAAAVAGGLPQGLTSLGSVVVTDGEATVDLGREAFTVPQDRRSRVIAQIASTLASVPGVFTVRVLVEERPYVGGPVDASIPAEFVAGSSGPVLAVDATGRLISVDGSRTRAVKWHGADPGALLDPISAPGGKRMVALRASPAGYQLIIADLSGASDSTVTATLVRSETIAGTATTTAGPSATVLRPQWLDPSRLLVAINGSSARVLLVDAAGGASRPVYAPTLAALGSLSAFAVSRDGTRVIAVAGPVGARKVYLARLTDASTQPDGAGQLLLDGWTQVPSSLPDVAAAAWSGDLGVTVLGAAAKSAVDPTGGLRVEDLSLDGVPDPNVQPALPAAVNAEAFAGGGALTLSSAPGREDLVSTGFATWTLQRGRWVRSGAFRAPAYP
jgi:hypothetical protein